MNFLKSWPTTAGEQQPKASQSIHPAPYPSPQQPQSHYSSPQSEPSPLPPIPNLPQQSAAVSESCCVPISICDPALTDDALRVNTTPGPKGVEVRYRLLQEAPWVRHAKIPLMRVMAFKFRALSGPQAVLSRVADLHNDFTSVCIYHTVMGGGVCGADSYHCSGPLSGLYTCYYVHYWHVMRLPPNTCFTCYCPTDEESCPWFHHPPHWTPKGETLPCYGREKYEDLYRGLTYIIFWCSVLQEAIFCWLGDESLSSKFVSTTDWARWLAMPASQTFMCLVNYFVIVWAYLEMFEAGVLPQGPLEFDGMVVFPFFALVNSLAFSDIETNPPLFSIPQA